MRNSLPIPRLIVACLGKVDGGRSSDKRCRLWRGCCRNPGLLSPGRRQRHLLGHRRCELCRLGCPPRGGGPEATKLCSEEWRGGSYKTRGPHAFADGTFCHPGDRALSHWRHIVANAERERDITCPTTPQGQFLLFAVNRAAFPPSLHEYLASKSWGSAGRSPGKVAQAGARRYIHCRGLLHKGWQCTSSAEERHQHH